MKYRVHLIHTCIDTDDSRSRDVVLDVALTGRGLAKAHRALEAEIAWKRRNFGPGTIRPAHNFYLAVAREDKSYIRFHDEFDNPLCDANISYDRHEIGKPWSVIAAEAVVQLDKMQ